MTIVITSKRAQKDLARIKGRHQDILREMADQADRVKAYNEQKKQEALAEQQRQQELRQKQIETAQRDREIAAKQT